MREKFSVPLSHVFEFVQHEVKRLGHACVEPEHLLLGLIEEKQGVAFQLLQNLNVDLADLQVELHEKLAHVKVDESCELLTMSEDTKRMLELSMDTRDLVARPYLGTEHLLIGLMRDISGRGYSILQRRGVTYNALNRTNAAASSNRTAWCVSRLFVSPVARRFVSPVSRRFVSPSASFS